MSLKVKEGAKGDFEITPEGTYIARCFKLIDLGTQTIEWQGEAKMQAKIMISWELLDPPTKMKDGRPFAVSKRYTASLHEKAALRKDLQSWRGKRFTDEELDGFDLTKVLGAYCQVQVVHTENNGTTYANVDAIMSTREKPEGINELVHFDIEEPDLEVFNGLSDKMQELIKSSPEWRIKNNPPAKETEIPFHETPDEIIGFDENEPINLDDIPF